MSTKNKRVIITQNRLEILNLINMKMTPMLETTQQTMEVMVVVETADLGNELAKFSNSAIY